jgi:hypothetical protein
VVVHGPAILGRATGIVVGLRCVFAHADGLLLPVVLHASGVQAEAAGKQRHRPRSGDALQDHGSMLAVHVRADDRAGPADPSRTTGSARPDSFWLEATYWLDVLPSDRQLHLTVAWPQVGMPESQTVLTLDPLDDVLERVLPL